MMGGFMGGSCGSMGGSMDGWDRWAGLKHRICKLSTIDRCLPTIYDPPTIPKETLPMPSPIHRLLAGLLAAASMAGAAAADKTQLLVYTALETDQLKTYKEAFERAHPDVSLKWVRDSTGVITAKLLAEKANPQADVVMGVAASSLV